MDREDVELELGTLSINECLVSMDLPSGLNNTSIISVYFPKRINLISSMETDRIHFFILMISADLQCPSAQPSKQGVLSDATL